MVIPNLFQINDWEIKRFLGVVVAVQLAMLGLVGLSSLGLEIPFLRQFIGFIYLTFIPGIIILRVLKLHRLGAVETLVYTVGLSLAFDMFLGYFINLLYPLFGVSKPISTPSFIITWTLILGLLSIVAYKRDKGFFITGNFTAGKLLSPQALFLILLPLLAIVGTQVVNHYQTNIVLLILLCLMTFLPIVVILTKLIPENLYPLAIYSVALTLLWHFSLVFGYLSQWDSFLEYHYFGLTADAGLWNSEIPHTYNAMLSITILPATFSQLLNMSGTALFKIIYPLWYALVPVGLYAVYSKHFNRKIALLAVFFFVSIYIFFLETPSLGRQMVAELFYILLIMLLTEREVTISKKVMFMVFGASLVVSHYSLSYLFMAFLMIIIIVLPLLREKRLYVTYYYAGLFAVICLAWYMYTSGSASIAVLAKLGKHIYQNFTIDFLNPFSRDVSLVFIEASPDALHWVYRILWYLMLFFIAIGATTIISSLRQKEARKEFSILAIGNYILLAGCIIIPFFAGTLGVQRMVHISSLVLAPFCILGAEIVLRRIPSMIGFIRRSHFWSSGLRIAIPVIFALFFLFNTSLPFEIVNSPIGISTPLIYGHVVSGDRATELRDIIYFRSSSPSRQEVTSAEWLRSCRNAECPVYGTYWQMGVPVLVSYGMISPEQIVQLTPLTMIEDAKCSYVYLGYVNVVLGYGTTRTYLGQPDPVLGDIFYWEISRIAPLRDDLVKIYTNGSSEVYWGP